MPSIYLAGPLFTAAERAFNSSLRDALVETGYKVFLPQVETAGQPDLHAVYDICIHGIESSDLILANLDGADADSGTCFEVGYARALGKPILAFRTDFRQSGDAGGVNLMLKYGATLFLEIQNGMEPFKCIIESTNELKQR